MDKESIYLLQKIDCNCNNCFFMERDIETYNKWAEWHRNIEFKEFEKAKEKAIFEANEIIRLADTKELRRSGEGMLRVANDMKFFFEKKFLLQYGNCSKFKKHISFIPNICQIETQECFSHRKDHEVKE